MYQIKINSFAQIMSDDVELDYNDFYQFVDNADNITFIENVGFIIECNNKSYLLRFTKEELEYFNSKYYDMLSIAYKKLIKRYHFLNEIVETHNEKREYLDYLYNNKPELEKIIFDNYKKIFGKIIDDKDIKLLISSGLIVIKEYYKSLVEYKRKIKEWEAKIEKIKKIEVKEFAFQLNLKIDTEIILDKMIMVNSLLRHTEIKQKNELIDLYNSTVLLYYECREKNDLNGLEETVMSRLKKIQTKI